ncbi:MAG TPA: stage II sporulation protein M [Solirubrobacteraceae bacterium]
MDLVPSAPSAYAFVEGMRNTRETLETWRRHPWRVLRGWLGGSLLAAVGLLACVWLVAAVWRSGGFGGDTQIQIIHPPFVVGDLHDVATILEHNLFVLALHAMACVAGFIAGSSLPEQARRQEGIRRAIHDKCGRLAIAFVIGATIFSLSAQGLLIGTEAAGAATRLQTSPGLLLVGLLPHALLELTALFLPLAAWIIASRRAEWDQLLAATFVTVAISVPALVLAALIEVYVSPHVLTGLLS